MLCGQTRLVRDKKDVVKLSDFFKWQEQRVLNDSDVVPFIVNRKRNDCYVPGRMGDPLYRPFRLHICKETSLNRTIFPSNVGREIRGSKRDMLCSYQTVDALGVNEEACTQSNKSFTDAATEKDDRVP